MKETRLRVLHESSRVIANQVKMQDYSPILLFIAKSGSRPSAASTSHSFAPEQPEPAGYDRRYQRKCHRQPKSAEAFLRNNKLVGIVKKSRRIFIGKIGSSEYPVPRCR